jgi:hypothetical protein
MGDKWIKNYFLLGILIFIIGWGINYSLTSIIQFFNISINTFDVGSFLVAVVLGIIYSKKNNEIMPRGLRLKTTAIFLALYLTIFIILLSLIGINIFGLVFSIIGILFIGIEVFLVYWGLGFSSKLYLDTKKNN